jgi:hypothetical protein
MQNPFLSGEGTESAEEKSWLLLFKEKTSKVAIPDEMNPITTLNFDLGLSNLFNI